MTKRFFHVRNIDRNQVFADVLPHGGMTILVQKSTLPGEVAVSYSECSLKDNFCRREGRSFAEKHVASTVALEDLPRHMRNLVNNSKRIKNPSVQDFDFATKYFKE